MERRPPSASRPRIPGGYGNYSGRDGSPPPQQRSVDNSLVDSGVRGRKKRAQAPWGGLFEDQAAAPLPTAPWTAGAPLHGRHDDLPPSQGQQQQRWLQNQNSARALGGGTYGPPQPHSPGSGPSFSSPPPPRHRPSPLVANAPRLTVIKSPPRSRGAVDDAAAEGRAAQPEQQQQQRGLAAPQTSLSLSGRGNPGFSRWGSWGVIRGGSVGDTGSGDTGNGNAESSWEADSKPPPAEERTALLAAARDGTSSGSYRSGLFSREQSAPAVGWGRRRPAGEGTATVGGSRMSGDGFAAAGRPSPFLLARSSASSTSGKWRSPLEQSAVNPFSASFGVRGGGRGGVDGSSWVSGNGGRGQPLVRRAGAGGGYGSGWGGGSGGWKEAGSSSPDKPKPLAKGRKVDDQGRQIFFKHGVRLVEAAEIQLESQGAQATYAVFILPYLLLALALWLDLGPLNVTSRFYPPSANTCNSSGVCSWTVAGAPLHNSFLMLKGKFTLVEGLESAEILDPIVGSGGVGDGEVEPAVDESAATRAAAAAAKEQGDGGGRRRNRRRRLESVGVHTHSGGSGSGGGCGSGGGGGDGEGGDGGGNISDDSGKPGISGREADSHGDAGVAATAAGEGGLFAVERGFRSIVKGSKLRGEVLYDGSIAFAKFGETKEGGEDEENGQGLLAPWRASRKTMMLPLGKEKEKEEDRVQIVVGVALEIQGLVVGTGQWESLYGCAARDNFQILMCHTTDNDCEQSVLGRVVFDSMGMHGQHSEYAVNATLKAVQHGKTVPGAGELLARSATFEIVTESELYAKIRSIARLPLLAFTAFALLYWMTRGFGGAGGERDPAPSAIVPERRYITLLLFGLLLWQNPVLAVEEWLALSPLGLSLHDSGAVWPWVRLGRDVCQFTGLQVMWLCWVCLMDGQHLVRSRKQRPDSDSAVFDGSASAADAAYRQVVGDDEQDGALVATAGDEPAGSNYFLKDDYPPHHPKSESFIDFILPKVLFGFLSLAVGVGVALLRHPYQARLDRVDWLEGRLELSYAIMSMASGLFWLGWVLYFVKVAISSGRVLRGQPFFGTRRQQLSYRVMLMQGVMVGVLFCVSVGVDLLYLVKHLLRQHAVAGASPGFTLESMTSNASGLSAYTGGVRQPLGLLILVSAVCYNLAYLFLPPTHSVKRLFDRMYINMERDMPPREVVRRYKDSQELSPLFCVETSCFLVEVAWQAYYDPHRVNLSDFVAPGRQDLSYLGLELVAYFNDETHEIRAILCRGEDRLILAFRGTARMENILTDLKFHQVPLPQLLPAGRDPIDIQIPDPHRATSVGRRYSGGLVKGAFTPAGGDTSRNSRPYSKNSSGSNRGSGGVVGGLRKLKLSVSRQSSRNRSRSEASRSPPLSSAAAAAAAGRRTRGIKGATAVSPPPPPQPRTSAHSRRGASQSPTRTIWPSTSPSPSPSPRTPSASSSPLVVTDAPSRPDDASVPVGGDEGGIGRIASAAFPSAGGAGAATASGAAVEHLVGKGAPAAVGAEGSTGHDEQADSGNTASKVLGEGEEEGQELTPRAGSEVVSQPRPKNPNDLIRLFKAENCGGGGGGIAVVPSASVTPGGSDSTVGKTDCPDSAGRGDDAFPPVTPTDLAAAAITAPAPAADAGESSAAAEGNFDQDDDADPVGIQEEPCDGERGEDEEVGHAQSEDEEGGPHEDSYRPDAPLADDSYRSGHNDNDGGDDVDLEAEADCGFGEEKFHIDPRGDGSFATTAARCFKAVVHRIPVARHALPRVHGGFWEAYFTLREKVLAALAVELQNDYRPLFLTGHSLGGALSQLAAYDIDKNFNLPDPMTLYTFGSPRVGNRVFARKLDSRVNHHFRVVNDGDLVTALPRFFGTYKHAGCKVVVDSERYGNFIVAPTLVEQTFGAKPLTSFSPHLLNQYRECLEACMEEADLEDYLSRGNGVDPTLVPEWLKGKRRRSKEELPELL